MYVVFNLESDPTHPSKAIIVENFGEKSDAIDFIAQHSSDFHGSLQYALFLINHFEYQYLFPTDEYEDEYSAQIDYNLIVFFHLKDSVVYLGRHYEEYEAGLSEQIGYTEEFNAKYKDDPEVNYEYYTSLSRLFAGHLCTETVAYMSLASLNPAFI